jgi:O-antigen/teichoic acid export membrane protein
MNPTESGTDASELTRSEVRGRALKGVLFVTASGGVNLFIGFLGNLALARMLTPEDFGVVAVGLTATLLGTAISDGGLGAGMIRRPEAPTRSELRTLNGIQLAIAAAVVVPVCLIALGFGRTGAITAIMIASLPITMLQTPGRVVLARNMLYDRQAAVDSAGQMSFYLFAVTAVVLGADVWGLATATLVRATVSTLLIAVLSVGFLAPSLRGWRGFGPLVAFGLRFQATPLLYVVREQGVNLVTAAIGGLSVLGLWTLASRLIQVPILAFTSLYTVGFPAMSRILAGGEDPAPIILRVVRRASIVATLVFPAFVAASPALIPALFGAQWADAANVIPFVGVSTVILGSISVGALSYLNAAGRPGIVAVATATFGVIWVGLTACLLPFLGIEAIGVGNLAGALVEAVIIDRATRRAAGIAPYRPLLRPLVVALFAGTAAWIVCVAGPANFAMALGAGALAFVLSAAGLVLVCRRDLRDTLQLATGMLPAGSLLRRKHT